MWDLKIRTSGRVSGIGVDQRPAFSDIRFDIVDNIFDATSDRLAVVSDQVWVLYMKQLLQENKVSRIKRDG